MTFEQAVYRYFRHGEMDDWAYTECMPVINQWLDEYETSLGMKSRVEREEKAKQIVYKMWVSDGL